MASQNTIKDSFIKVCIKGNGDKISYSAIPRNYSILLFETIKPLIPNENLSKIRIYWIDEDGDQITINNDVSFQLFMKISEKKKIFVETKEIQECKVTFIPTTEARPTSATQKSTATNGTATAQNNQSSSTENEKIEHENIECDACGECPIIGFRYKCIQCPNFDLCGRCEAKMLHKQHAMFRFPQPIDRFHLHRSFFKKMKRNCFMRPECGESEDDSRGHGRHGHRRSHGSGGRQNIFTNLYTMMHDLAEGTDVPMDIDESSSATKTAQKGQDDTKKTENTQKNQNSTEDESSNNNEKQEQQQEENGIPEDIKIDPNYAKVGIQIMKNFSDMFAKMLDPLGISVEVDFDLKKDNVPKGDKQSKENEAASADGTTNATAATADVVTDKEEKSKDTSLPEKFSADENANNVSEKSSSGEQEQQQTLNDGEKKKDSINDEAWTLIDKNVEDKSTSPIAEEGAVGNASNSQQQQQQQETVSVTPEVINYSKLSQDLWQHIKRGSEERKKAEIRYHEKPHINNAVIAMIAMGFSNEGQWLTHLLESVDGDISQALDLMKPIK